MDNSNDFATGYAVGRDTNENGCGNGMWGGEWLGYLLLFALIGGGGFGFGGFGGGGILPWLLFGNGGFGGAGATNGYVLTSDFANIERKLDGINNGICDGFYAQNTNMLNGFAGVQQTLCQGFSGIDRSIANLGYQQSQCCCETKGAIKDVAYGNEKNAWTISKQISDCCCDLEKMNMQNRFDAQAYNCNTLQAIDKLGDRIDNRLNAMENARVRAQLDSERNKNAVLQGQIDRAQLRYDIVNDVRPCPQPAYITCNPYAYTNPCNTGCGCGNF